MGEFLSYSITSGLSMLAMYLAYRLFLARDNQHSFNRGVLLLIYFAAFVGVPLTQYLLGSDDPTQVQTVAAEGIAGAGGAAAGIAKPIWGTIAIWIFIAGMAVAAARTALTWIRLYNTIRSGKKIKFDGYTLVLTDDERLAPFSWIRYVVISRKDYDSNCSVIATHELKHIAARHWIDLLAAQIVCIINWFNPAAWLMRDELMLIHEYQADMAVIQSGHDPRDYQMLLIKKAVGARFPSLANSLNHSKLKKRITMMYKEKSGAGHRFKALALVPMLGVALCVAGVAPMRAAVSAISNSDVSVGKVSENKPQKQGIAQHFKVVNINYDGEETSVLVKGEGLGDNLTTTGGSFTTDGQTYHANHLKCNLSNGAATLTATFPCSYRGKNTSMTLTINGEPVTFDLDDFLNNAQSVMVGDRSDSSVMVYSYNTGVKNEDNSSNMQIFLNGKEITEAQMHSLPTEDIESVTVNKKSNVIYITRKKK